MKTDAAPGRSCFQLVIQRPGQRIFPCIKSYQAYTCDLNLSCMGMSEDEVEILQAVRITATVK